MKPDEALHNLENLGGIGVPRLYADMPRPMLERLVQECARMSGTERSEAALTAWAQQRLKQPNWLGIAEKKMGLPPSRPENEEPAPCLVEPQPEEPSTRIHRALKPERLSTPGRRRAAFRAHFARCRSIVEAAARTGVDRRTVQRWCKAYPVFDQQCRDIIEARRQQAVENIVLAADHVEVRPVFYRGKKIGEYTRRDRGLDLYLLKQADAEVLKSEKRREAEVDFEARVAAEVERQVAQRLSERSRSPRHDAVPADDEFTNVANDFDPSRCDIALAP